MKEKGQIYKKLPTDLVMIFQNIVMILPRFFDFERPYLSPQAKFKKPEATFVAINMLNKCAKFHKDSSNGKKENLKAIVPLAQTRRIILRDTPVSMGIR